MVIIKEVKAREILDSRGNPTVEVEIKTKDSFATASCPSGASVGTYEACELRDGGVRYDGLGVKKAVYNVNEVIAKNLIGHELDLEFIDSFLCELDGTENKSRLGANAILPVSMACYRLYAKAKNKSLYSVLGNKKILPVPFMNLINGGKHANNHLSFQEYMIAPRLKNFNESLRIGTEIYHYLGELVKKKYSAYGIGDEGGFAPKLKKSSEGFELLSKAVDQLGYTKYVKFALDAAATSFYFNGKYIVDNKKLTAEQLLKLYEDLISKYKLVSIEDPFHENDFEHFRLLKKVMVVTDDLTVTNIGRIKKAINYKACNCVLLKMNQIGTVTETLKTAEFVFKNKLKAMVSHRSGETCDSFISDLAVGLGCGMIKAGAPARSERLAKYNRLSEISENSWRFAKI